MSFVWYFSGAVVGGGGCVGTYDVCVVDGVGKYGVILFISLLLMLLVVVLQQFPQLLQLMNQLLEQMKQLFKKIKSLARLV